jgi:cytoskeletal protein RodZ
MSLINEALKKAQKQREAEAAAKSGKVPVPGTGGPTVPPPPPPSAPPSAAPEPEPDRESPSAAYTGPASPTRAASRKSKMPFAAIVVLVVLLGGGVGWWAVGPDDPAMESGETHRVSQADPIENEVLENQRAAATPPSDPAPEPAATTPAEAPSPIVQFVLPDESPAPSMSATNAQTPAPAPAVASTPAEEVRREPAPEPRDVPAQRPAPITPTAPSPAPAVGEAAPAMTSNVAPAVARVEILPEAEPVSTSPPALDSAAPDPAVLAYLESARITGVRASPTDPKVLMNNRVFRLNEMVDGALQLRVTDIDARQLEFTDARGFVYTKSF